MEPGTYKFTATVAGGMQASQVVKTQANKPALVALEMNKAVAMANKKKVAWGTPATGTRIPKRYKDDDAAAADRVGADNVTSVRGDTIDGMMRQTTTIPPKALGGQ